MNEPQNRECITLVVLHTSKMLLLPFELKTSLAGYKDEQ
jgi:hypothetical protein